MWLGAMTLDELGEYGMARMDDDEIDSFLSSQSIGVLGLSTADAPLMRPISFWFDGDETVYMPYVLGASSRKKERSDAVDTARLLVYRAETPFNWQSVLLTGGIAPVPEEKRDEIEDALETRWRPDVFERATAEGTTELYRLRIEDRAGIKHLGLPPAFEDERREH